MSFGDKVKDFFGLPADDEDTGDNGYESDGEDYITSHGDSESSGYNADTSSSSAKKNKVVNINTTTSLKVVLVKPERFADASAIADHLRQKRTVVLNLESCNKEITRRLVDFLSGVAYADNGEIKRVAAATYIITPFNVDIVGDLLDELESSGAFIN